MNGRTLTITCLLLATLLPVRSQAAIFFQGGVYEGAMPDTSVPIEGALVQLWANYGTGPSGSEGPLGWIRLVEAATGPDGGFYFCVDIPEPVLALELRQIDRDGYVSVAADCPEPGVVITPSTIAYPGDLPNRFDYGTSGIRFWDALAPEPGAMLCLLAGFGGLFLRRRRSA